MERTDIKTGETIITSAPFRTNNQVVLESTDLNEFYEISKQKILESLSLYQQAGSGWRFVSVENMDINIIEYNPFKAKSYIPLDKNLATKKAIINIKNEDNQCFKWCVTKALNPTDENSERVDKELKNQAEKINWDKIEFPVSLNQITQFEKNNQDISVNVYGSKNSEVHILHISKDNDRKHLIDLLLISNEFNSEESLSNHKTYCKTHDSVRIELSPPNSTTQFTNHNKSMRVPFVVYADFENFIKQIDTCEPNPNESYTKQYQKHIPSSFCYYIKCFDKSFYQSSPKTDDVAQIFVDSLQEDIKKIYATEYHICGKDLGKDKVRDHFHITGKCRGAAHQNFDECIKEGKKVEVKRVLRFLNSYRFMSDSLNALSKNLAKDQCKNTRKLYSNKKLDLLLRKGVYPYDWVDSINRFNETQLPPKDSFFSKLTDEDISDNDYSHAQNVWNEFNCKTFRDYHDLCNVSNVLLQADVFENFRDVCMNIYKLDPAWYYTSPELAWDAALKKTKVKLELLSDYDIVLIIKKGIRGGISMISNRLGTSNNKYMSDEYDQSKPSTFIQYLDANNLYG
ncbi:uncharacterized protein LOC136081548 [Hydra vulgaris]|uniref:Uncharacterized protein LOC136081548 n=1 Tax=Hydra vulgaris TaxID=6087 RepID=A0ABM4C086_HYDVU